MPPRKDLTKEQVKAAIARTKSNMAAARWLNVSYPHFKKWAKFYKSDKEGFNTLFDEHLNASGKGISKFLKHKGNKMPIKSIIEGDFDVSSYDVEKVKRAIFREGYLLEECAVCKFSESRVTDGKTPLLLDFIDNNKYNFKLNNLRVLCYNCYFLYVTDVFTKNQIQNIESYAQVSKGEVTWELDDYQKRKLKELNLYDPSLDDNDEEDDNPYDLVSGI